MPKIFLAMALAAVLLVGAVACGDSGGTTTPVPAETTPAATPAQTTPAQPSGADPAAQFTELCAGCHKSDGSGGFGPDIRSKDNVGRIAEQIREGGNIMPSFSGDLTDAQIQALAEYVANEL